MNMTKYRDPLIVGVGVSPQTSECTRSNGESETEVLVVKDNASCFVV